MSIVVGFRRQGRVPALQRQRFTRWYRRVKWVRRPAPRDPWGVFAIKARFAWVAFFAREVPFDVSGGRGFLVRELGAAKGATYHVELSASGSCRCDCGAFAQRSRCRHVAALGELIDRGDFPPAGAAVRAA